LADVLEYLIMFDLSRIARGVGFILLMTLLLMFASSAGAQQAGNLLVNGHMEGGFSERDGVTGVPLGWAFYQIAGSPEADRQEFAPYSYSSPTFWVIRSAYQTWIAGGMQTVQVTPGITYRFGVYAFIWTCNDSAYYCTEAERPRYSHTESNARVRVGIDPNGGVDPNSANVAWGPWVQPFDQYQGLTVDATAASSNLTVFMQGDSGQAMAFNEIYWDSATLVPVTATPAAANNPVIAAPGNSAPPPVSPSEFVPFVNPQQARPDGSVVHLVQAGDTFLSILVAYTDLGISREGVMALNGWRWEPDYINIGDEIIILPPGSVDPSSGQILNSGAAVVPAQPQTEQAATVPEQAAVAPPVAETNTQPAASLRTIPEADIATVPAVESITAFLPQ
jgi:hypothetical protein